MARIVHVACARCGYPEMVVVGAEEESVAEIEQASRNRAIASDDTAMAALRLQRLKKLPTSLPVGGIITPV